MPKIFMPQYVTQFNGASSWTSIPNSASLNPTTQITISAWVYASITSTNGIVAKDLGGGGITNHSYSLQTSGSQFEFLVTNSLNGASGTYAPALTLNKWYFIVGTYDGSNQILYVNGVNINQVSLPAIATTTGTLNIGQQKVGYPRFWEGFISNIQIYNTSLDATTVNALYMEGIGGSPQSHCENLVAWYPLNGNTNDTSGNNNNGVPTNVVYTSTWTSGYTLP